MKIAKFMMATALLLSVPLVNAQTQSDPPQLTLSDDHSQKQDIDQSWSLFNGGKTYPVKYYYYNSTVQDDGEEEKVLDIPAYGGGDLVNNTDGSKTPTVTKPQTYVIDFGERTSVEKISMQWEKTLRGIDYTIAVSDDGDRWTTVATVTGADGSDGAGLWDNFLNNDPTNIVFGRYIKIHITNAGEWKDWAAHITSFDIRSQRIPTTITIESSNGDIIPVGESTAISATVYDQKGMAMTPVRPIEITYEGAEGLVADNVYTPKTGGEKITVTATCGDAEPEKLILRSFDIDHFYTLGGEILESDGEAGLNNVSRIFDSSKDYNDFGNGGNYYFHGDGTSNGTEEYSAILKLTMPVDIELLRINWATSPTEFTISVSQDGKEFTEIGTRVNANGTSVSWHNFGCDIPDVQYIRINTTKGWTSGWGIQLRELKIYGTYEVSQPSYIKIVSSEGNILNIGQASTITAAVYDQYDLEITELASEITLLMEGDNGQNFVENVYTPSIESKNATFTASYGDLKETLEIITRYPDNISIETKINQATADPGDSGIYGNILLTGESANLKAKVYDQFGEPIADNIISDYLTWTTEAGDGEWDGSVYTPSESGVVSFTANCGDASANIKINTVVENLDIDKYIAYDANDASRNHISKVTINNNSIDNFAVLFNNRGEDINKNGGGEYTISTASHDNEEINTVIIELDRGFLIEDAVLYWDCIPASFTISLSENGKEYTTVVSDKNYKTDGIHAYYRWAFNPTAARFVKIETVGSVSAYGLKLGEVALYGIPEVSIPSDIQILSSNGSALAAGESTILTAKVLDQFGTYMDGLEGFIWTTSGFTTDSRLISYEDWSKLENPEYKLEHNQSLLIAGKDVSGEHGLNIFASCPFDLTGYENKGNHSDEELRGTVESVSPLVMNGFEIKHYLFDGSLHEGYSRIDLAGKAAESIEINTDYAPNKELDTKKLFNGGKELNQNGPDTGNGYEIIAEGSPADAQSEIIVSFYDPVDLEAVVLRWERACPSSYKIEVNNDSDDEIDWDLIGEFTDIMETNPDDEGNFNHRFGIRYKDHEDQHEPITQIRITTFGNNLPQYGLKLHDIKAYGTYPDINPVRMELDPYVNVDYKKESGDILTHDHPNTVVFFEETANTQFAQEYLYPNPRFFSKYGAEFHLRHPELIEYRVRGLDGTNSDAAVVKYDIDEREDGAQKVIYFSQQGNYEITATYEGPVDVYDEATGEYVTYPNDVVDGERVLLTKTTQVLAVHHNKMVAWGLLGLNAMLINKDTREADHETKGRETQILMSGRTAEDGGVDGSANFYNDGKMYDLIIDMGRVFDITAVEVYWEGACPKSYKISMGREINSGYEIIGEDSQTEKLEYPERRAVIDRPRFDRFAVKVGGYTRTQSQPQGTRRNAEGEQPRPADYVEPANGSTTAIRYITIHNVKLDPWMGNVWGAKLAEITPYYDPNTAAVLPTSVEGVTNEDANAPVYYYNLQGQRVINPMPGDVLIRRQGDKSNKIIFR